MVADHHKGKRQLVEEIRVLRSKLSRLEPVEFKAGQAEHMSVEDVLRAGDGKYRPLFDNMLNGFAYCRILVDENEHPVDFIYLDVNKAFEKLTGLKKEDVVGKKVTEAIPGIKEAHPELFDIYGEVALTGKEAQFEIFFKPLGIWLSVSAYSPGRGYFVAIFENITEQKKAAEALRETTEYFQNLVTYANAPIIVWDPQSRISQFNHAFEFLTGRKAGDVIGKPLELLFPLAVAENTMRLIRKTLTGQRLEVVEIDIQHIDGSVRTVLWNSATILAPDGKTIAAIIAQGQDITERKRVEEALQKSEAQKQAILDGITANIAFVKENLEILWVNKTAAASVGKLPKEMIGHKCYEFWADPEKPCDDCPTVRAFETKKSEHTIMQTPDGRVWDEHGEPVFDSEGRLIGVVEIAQDITGRKQAEQALQESEIRFRELFESISSGVAVYEAINDGEDFVFKDMNKAGERIDEINRADIIGKKVTEVFPGVKKLGLFEVFQRVWRTGKPEYHPCSFYEDERIFQWVENHVYKLPSGEIVTVYDDVTARKQAEEKLTDYHSKLKAMAISSLLTEERQRQLIAQGLHYDIGQKLAMAKIDLLSSLRDEAHQPAPELTEKICSNIDAMIERVRSLTFELSNPVLTELGLEAAIERHLGREVRDKYGIEFELVRCGLLTHLDENLNICLFRTVRELLNNIIKHAQAKKVTVSLSRENNEIIIIVEDDGIGFDVSEVKGRIGSGGTFGLFSVQEQLESFGGRLKIKSNPGQGSRFTIVMSSDAKVTE